MFAFPVHLHAPAITAQSFIGEFDGIDISLTARDFPPATIGPVSHEIDIFGFVEAGTELSHGYLLFVIEL
jgi:hypothetical protein